MGITTWCLIILPVLALQEQLGNEKKRGCLGYIWDFFRISWKVRWHFFVAQLPFSRWNMDHLKVVKRSS